MPKIGCTAIAARATRMSCINAGAASLGASILGNSIVEAGLVMGGSTAFCIVLLCLLANHTIPNSDHSEGLDLREQPPSDENPSPMNPLVEQAVAIVLVGAVGNVGLIGLNILLGTAANFDPLVSVVVGLPFILAFYQMNKIIEGQECSTQRFHR